MVGLGWFMQFNATFNNISVISWQSVLLVEETVVPLTCRKSLTNFIYNFRIKSAMYKRSIGRMPKLRSSNKTAQYKLSIKGQYLLPLPVDDNSCQHQTPPIEKHKTQYQLFLLQTEAHLQNKIYINSQTSINPKTNVNATWGLNQRYCPSL